VTQSHRLEIDKLILQEGIMESIYRRTSVSSEKYNAWVVRDKSQAIACDLSQKADISNNRRYYVIRT
jgi:hypothetical protein